MTIEKIRMDGHLLRECIGKKKKKSFFIFYHIIFAKKQI